MTTENQFARKLWLKPGDRALILNAPEGYVGRLEPLPNGVIVSHEPSGQFDFVQMFARTKAEVDALAPRALDALRSGGVLWVCWPKRSSGVKTDLTRDQGWDVLVAAGWRGIASVAIDEVWSAVRYRPTADIRRRKGSEANRIS